MRQWPFLNALRPRPRPAPDAAAQIVRLYAIVLARSPDPAGLVGWIEQRRRGRSLEDIAAAFLASPEFTTRHAGEDARAILHRNARAHDPDAAPLPFRDLPPPALAAALARDPGAHPRSPLLPLLCPDGVPLTDPDLYRLWLSELPRPSKAERAAMRAASGLPSIGFVMIGRAARPTHQAAAIAAVLAQTYPNIELLLPRTPIAPPDPRMRVFLAPRGASLAAAFNAALAACTADLIAVIGAGDLLADTAAFELATAATEADIIIADDDALDATGQRHSPRLGAEWDADAILAAPCPGFGVLRTDLARTIGGMPTGRAGVEEWAVLLQAATRVAPSRIRRLNAILLSRADPPTPAASRRTRIRLIRHHLAATNRTAAVAACRGRGHPIRITYPVPANPPLVSIIIPTRDRPDLLRACVDGLLHRTDYPEIEILLLDNGSADPAALDLLARLAAHRRITVLRNDAPFNWSALNNQGVAAAGGEIVVLLNNDIQVMDPGWLRELVAQALRPEIGIVGALLLYADRTVQHAGAVLGPHGRASHMWRHSPAAGAGYLDQLRITRQVSALTGACLALRRGVYNALGGLDEALPVTWSDTDLCLRVRAHGLRVLWTPHARLLHPEQSTRGSDDTPQGLARLAAERAWMRARWGDALDHDPFLPATMLPSETLPMLRPLVSPPPPAAAGSTA